MKGKSRGKNRNGKGNFRERYSKDQRRDIEIADTARKAENDPSWYAQNPQLVKDSASYPFAIPVGAPFIMNDDAANTTGLDAVTVPGVMVLAFAPTVGVSTDLTSAINVAAVNIYTFVRHQNSGHSNYDPADLMLYLVAMDSLYMFHSMARRVYGVARDYTPYNRYYPATILNAMGMDPDDVYANMAQLRYAVNMMADKLSHLCVPAGMDFFTRHRWMCEGLYTDTASVKAQTYAFQPHMFWQYDNTATTGTNLKTLPWSLSGLHTVAQLVSTFNTLYNAVMGDEDVGIMSGDILKAYGQGNLLKVADIAEDYRVLPMYSLEVLSQIQNSMAFNNVDYSKWAVTQDPSVNNGAIIASYGMSAAPSPLWTDIMSGRTMLTMYKDDVTPDDMMVATRLRAIVDASGSAPSMKSCGSEIVTGYRVAMNTHGNPAIWDTIINVLPNPSVTSIPFGEQVAAMSQFDYHPVMYMGHAGTSEGSYVFDGFLSDINNYTLVTGDDILRMHEVALLSEFWTPGINKA